MKQGYPQGVRGLELLARVPATCITVPAHAPAARFKDIMSRIFVIVEIRQRSAAARRARLSDPGSRLASAGPSAARSAYFAGLPELICYI
jgi:hypothetical protein